MPMAFQDTSGEGGSTVETVGKGVKTTFPARAVACTPSNEIVFSFPSAIYVGSAGTIIVVPWSDDTPDSVTFDMQDGCPVPVMVKQVLVGGTASDLVRVF